MFGAVGLFVIGALLVTVAATIAEWKKRRDMKRAGWRQGTLGVTVSPLRSNLLEESGAASVGVADGTQFHREVLASAEDSA